METLEQKAEYKIGESLWINFWSASIIGEVCGVHMYRSKEKYDFKVFGGGGVGVTRIYNIDSAIVSRTKQ